MLTSIEKHICLLQWTVYWQETLANISLMEVVYVKYCRNIWKKKKDLWVKRKKIFEHLQAIANAD